jgi:hypothetical protein
VKEILLGVKPFMQPYPLRNSTGDCFACALTAAVRHLYPEDPISFETVWDAFVVKSLPDGDPVLCNTWGTMASTAPHALRKYGYDLQIHRDIVMPSPDLRNWSHAWGFQICGHEFAMRLEAWLSAGWIAISEVNLAGDSGRSIDHYVLLDGQRQYWEKNKDHPGVSTGMAQTHVVCSARGEYWINTGDLLKKHGTAGLVLIRKDER